jgi:anti-sigma factor RsiW
VIRRTIQRRRFIREHRWTHAHLSDYLDSELDERRRERVENHVTLCPECHRVLATLRRTMAGLRSIGADRGGETVAAGVIDRLRREG